MTEQLSNHISVLQTRAGEISIEEMLEQLALSYPGQVCFSTSFSWEDQIITHYILSNNLPIKIFTLDTGRLFPETYSVWSRTIERYNATIDVYYPDNSLLQPFVTEKGPNSFYEAPENRIGCCHIRKVEPLRRALKGNSIWVTGLRAEHSPNRHDLQPFEWDEVNGLIKYHPIVRWSTEEVKSFIAKYNIPYNILHDRGFVSIGCQPCTRAIKQGEDFRAGRWWWEDSGKKECGLHVHGAGI
ncbi:MAG: phosphoadenylyl-sulfate reductase [Segetibacter sp.]|jgi:phosphoadenosine phosphosulfate reductase|nr:phosphoadenylyl-sulfate reductase [Segetibacter sp.]